MANPKKPICKPIAAFDATQDHVFEFEVVSDEFQITANQLTIKKQEDNTIVYSNTVEAYPFRQTVSANTLTNGVYYTYQFKVRTGSGDNIRWSLDSDAIPFYCYSKPSIEFTNIPSSRIIHNPSYTFEFAYSQSEGELFQNLVVKLYDKNQSLIRESNKIYYTGSNTITYKVSNLLQEVYFIQVEGITTENTEFSSELEQFSVVYSTIDLPAGLHVENRCDEGYNYIYSTISFIEGQSQPDPPIYLNDEKIKLLYPNDYVKWVDGYSIPKNFIIEIWGSPVMIDNFFKIWNDHNDELATKWVREIPYGEISVKDYFVVEAKVDNETKVLAKSNYVDLMNNNTNYTVWIKKNENNWELLLNIIDTQSNALEWNGTSNVEYNRITDMSWVDESYLQGNQFNEKLNDLNDMLPLTSTELSNGIYNHFNITQDITKNYSKEIPSWDINTIMDCDFNNNINAGNIDLKISQLSYLILRRKSVDKQNWITLHKKEIKQLSDAIINYKDKEVPNGENVIYALIPILADGAEGTPVTIEVDNVRWNGVFISTKDDVFKLYNGVTYGSMSNNKQIGLLQPLARKYPFVIQNSINNYISGSVSGNLYGYDFEHTKRINRRDVIKQTQDLLNILESGNAICIKDWNGNIWIARSSSSETIDYNSSYGNGITTITMSFVEQGKYDNQSDLYDNGLIDEKE